MSDSTEIVDEMEEVDEKAKKPKKKSTTDEKIDLLAGAVVALAEKEREREELAKMTPRDKAAKEQRERTVKEVVDNLERLGGKLAEDDEVRFEGATPILPEHWSLRQGRDFLVRKVDESEEEMVLRRTFNFRPWDGAWCTMQVLKRDLGAVSHRETIRFTFFGPMPEPPQMIAIKTDVGKTEMVPWGEFSLPHLEGVTFETGAEPNQEHGLLFTLTAKGPRKHRWAIEGIFERIREELETNSLYRGKAFDGQDHPEFVDVNTIDPGRVVYSEEVTAQLEGKIWGQLRYPEAFADQLVKTKQAILIHGDYGTGKTLALMLTGQEALKAGYTFIKARPGRDNLKTVLKTARLYQPCVVAYEDIEQEAAPLEDGSDRSSISRLLDDFDGFDAKGTKILAVLTTNHPEQIHKGMARPGRLDAMIEIGDLDVKGVESLVRVTIPEGTLSDRIDWDAVFDAAQGYRPAFVTGFADDAKKYLIVRCKGDLNGAKIETSDLVHAARGLRPQFEKMQDAKDSLETESLGLALERKVRDAIESTMAPDVLAKNQ